MLDRPERLTAPSAAEAAAASFAFFLLFLLFFPDASDNGSFASASLLFLLFLALLLNTVAASEGFARPETDGTVGACWIPSDGPDLAPVDFLGMSRRED